MGKRRRRRKSHQKIAALPRVAQPTSEAPEKTVEDALDIGIADDEIFPAQKTGVSREVRNITILMTSLIAVVLIVILINLRNGFVEKVGQRLMEWLHIWGA